MKVAGEAEQWGGKKQVVYFLCSIKGLALINIKF